MSLGRDVRKNREDREIGHLWLQRGCLKVASVRVS